MLAYVVEHMAIKEELNAFRDEFKAFREETAENSRAIRLEIADIHGQLEELQTRVNNISGYSKEIDHALARIAHRKASRHRTAGRISTCATPALQHEETQVIGAQAGLA